MQQTCTDAFRLGHPAPCMSLWHPAVALTATISMCVDAVLCIVWRRCFGVCCRAGCYCLQYSLKPELPNGRTLRFSIDLEVTAGPPVGFDIQVGVLCTHQTILTRMCSLSCPVV